MSPQMLQSFEHFQAGPAVVVGGFPHADFVASQHFMICGHTAEPLAVLQVEQVLFDKLPTACWLIM